jgi:transporter family-2 protein
MDLHPHPLPTGEGIAASGGDGRRGAVVASLLFVGQVGTGTFGGLTITANILMSLLIDKYGWFGMTIHDLSPGRAAGAILMVAGIVLISRF